MTLYLGLRPPKEPYITHYPVIKIVPLTPPPQFFFSLPRHSHLLFTSQTAVDLFFKELPPSTPLPTTILSIGQQTTKTLLQHNLTSLTAYPETSEGVISLLQTQSISSLAWPHSALSRPLISNYLTAHNIPFTDCPLYTTETQIPSPPPDLSPFNEVIFTSPSTVDGFFAIWDTLPSHITPTPIGPITQHALSKRCGAIHHPCLKNFPMLQVPLNARRPS